MAGRFVLAVRHNSFCLILSLSKDEASQKLPARPAVILRHAQDEGLG